MLRAFETAWQPFNIRFRCILGLGGMGLAALFDIQSQPSATPATVVIKFDLGFLQGMGGGGGLFFPTTLVDEAAFHDVSTTATCANCPFYCA